MRYLDNSVSGAKWARRQAEANYSQTVCRQILDYTVCKTLVSFLRIPMWTQWQKWSPKISLQAEVNIVSIHLDGVAVPSWTVFSDVSFWDSLPSILVSKEMLIYFPHRLLTGDELNKAQSFSRLRKRQSEVSPDLGPGKPLQLNAQQTNATVSKVGYFEAKP